MCVSHVGLDFYTARGQSTIRGGHTRSGRALAPQPAYSLNARSDTHDLIGDEHAQSRGQPAREFGRSGGAPPQFDPTVILDMLAAIQNKVDGLKAQMIRELARDDFQASTPTVKEPEAPQMPPLPLL